MEVNIMKRYGPEDEDLEDDWDEDWDEESDEDW